MRIGWKAARPDPKIASFRYRVQTPVGALRAFGHAVEVYDRANADAYDLVVFSKTYSAEDRHLARDLRDRGAKVVFDICDNHFYNPFDLPRYREIGGELTEMISLADRVVCSTPALARIVQAQTNGEVKPLVVGDLVEKVELPPDPEPASPRRRLLWFGSHGSPNAPAGMSDLLLIARVLSEAEAYAPLELIVCSNNQAKFEAQIAPLPLSTRYVEWSPDALKDCLAAADAVVIPISPNPFTACKTHNRLTLSLYAGVPVVADSIESYQEFAPWCTLDNWTEGLRKVLEDNLAERARALAGRPYIDEHWSEAACVSAWEQALELPRAHAPVASPEPAAVQPARKAVRRKNGRKGEDHSLQGALDIRANGELTGWVRSLESPGQRLHVRLELAGVTLVGVRADEPRDDLAQAGFGDFECGFRFPLADLPEEAFERPFSVIVEETGRPIGDTTYRALGSGEMRHVLPDAPLDTQDIRAETQSPDAPDPRQEADMRLASAAQQHVAQEIERLTRAVDEARQSATRLIIALGDDPRYARRVLAAFAKGRPREAAE